MKRLNPNFIQRIFSITGKTPKEGEKVIFTPEEKQNIDAQTKQEGLAEKFMNAYNAENDSEEITALVNEFFENYEEPTNPDAASDASATENSPVTPKELSAVERVKKMAQIATTAIQENTQLTADIKKLAAEPEPDNPETITVKHTTDTTMKHSNTHLFSSNHSWDAFEGRNWNKLIAGHSGVTATTWTAVDISKLNTDVQDYFRKDFKTLVKMFMDAFKLPDHWEMISGVSDELLFTQVNTGEVTQGIKRQFLPKNTIKFTPIKNKIRDIQIDLKWSGYELKKLEKSYLNYYFNEGSTPHKMGFIMYAVEEHLRTARKEDKVGIAKGVYSNDPERTKSGSFLNRFSGVIKIALENRDVNYKSYKFGKPTVLNIDKYIKKMCDGLPYDIKNQEGLYFYMSPSWGRAYDQAIKLNDGRNVDYVKNSTTIQDYPNIKQERWDGLEGTDFFFITVEKNIGPMTDRPEEASILKFQEDGRDIKAFADYKLGVYFKAFGRNQIGSTTSTYEDQLFWSNDVEALQDIYVPVAANESTPSLKEHHSLIIGANNTASTDITNFTDATKGQKVYLFGNPDGNASTVKNNAQIKLIDGDCVLSENVLLVLMAKQDGTFQELYRETVGVADEQVDPEILAPDATTFDASVGSLFETSENTQATAIASITNGTSDETIRIQGGSSTNATTIADGGSFVLDSTMTLNAGTYIELYFNGSKWVETDRG